MDRHYLVPYPIQGFLMATQPDLRTAPLSEDEQARQRALGIFAKAELKELKHALDSFGPDNRDAADFDWLRPPVRGMVMVQGRAGGVGQVFNLGEMTVTRCAVRLKTGAVGFGYVRGLSSEHATIVALLDALLSRCRWQGPAAAKVLEPLAAAQAERRRERLAKANATKVDFFTLVRGDTE